MIKLQTKRFELNFLLKLSDLKSNFTLTLGYLNPALNNPGLVNSVFPRFGSLLIFTLNSHWLWLLWLLCSTFPVPNWKLSHSLMSEQRLEKIFCLRQNLATVLSVIFEISVIIWAVFATEVLCYTISKTSPCFYRTFIMEMELSRCFMTTHMLCTSQFTAMMTGPSSLVLESQKRY